MTVAVAKQPSRPRVLIIGTDDVDARIELMQRLRDEFTLAAAGTSHALQRRFSEAGFRYFYYPLARGNAPLTDGFAFVALLRLLAGFRPTIVHSFDSKPCVYGRLAAWLARVPVVVGTIPGLGSLYVETGPEALGLPRRVVRGIYELLQRLASRASQLTIFQNHDDAEEFLAKGVVQHDKVTVIPGSGVRTDVFDSARIDPAARRAVRASLGVPEGALLVTMVSRVIRSKGVEDYAAAAARVRQAHPNAHFLLVGPADEKSLDRFNPSDLAQLAATVNWPGARSDIPSILAASDIFVLPSYYREGIPRVLIEAASMSLPLVTTRSPGCVEVVEDSVNGFLVPVRDPDALVSAISRLVRDPELRSRFGQESRRRAVERFDLSAIAERTRSIYRTLAAGAPFLPGQHDRHPPLPPAPRPRE
jgi:glycosyltransferase involved in cell wall biosynthesis